uniref:(northern house mosquito) hypothetical protein n=1 Tax=Culex pipiens TaxID=7175 RepID=A0A8D8C7B3_CULPI
MYLSRSKLSSLIRNSSSRSSRFSVRSGVLSTTWVAVSRPAESSTTRASPAFMIFSLRLGTLRTGAARAADDAAIRLFMRSKSWRLTDCWLIGSRLYCCCCCWRTVVWGFSVSLAFADSARLSSFTVVVCFLKAAAGFVPSPLGS